MATASTTLKRGVGGLGGPAEGRQRQPRAEQQQRERGHVPQQPQSVRRLAGKRVAQMDQHDPRNEQERDTEHGQERRHGLDDLAFGGQQREQAARQDLTPNAVERERVEGGEIVEEMSVYRGVVGRDELSRLAVRSRGHAQAEHERDRQDQDQHGPRLWEKNQADQNTTLVGNGPPTTQTLPKHYLSWTLCLGWGPRLAPFIHHSELADMKTPAATLTRSYGYGWQQFKKYFLHVFLVGLVLAVASTPSNLGWRRMATHEGRADGRFRHAERARGRRTCCWCCRSSITGRT